MLVLSLFTSVHSMQHDILHGNVRSWVCHMICICAHADASPSVSVCLSNRMAHQSTLNNVRAGKLFRYFVCFGTDAPWLIRAIFNNEYADILLNESEQRPSGDHLHLHRHLLRLPVHEKKGHPHAVLLPVWMSECVCSSIAVYLKTLPMISCIAEQNTKHYEHDKFSIHIHWTLIN